MCLNGQKCCQPWWCETKNTLSKCSTLQQRIDAITWRLPLLSLLLLQETLRGRKWGSPWPVGPRTPVAVPRRGGAESTHTLTPIRTDAAGSTAPTRSQWSIRLIPIRSLRNPVRVPSLSFATSTAGYRRAFHFSSCCAPSWSSSMLPVSARWTVLAFWTSLNRSSSLPLMVFVFRAICWGRHPYKLSVCQQKYPDSSLSAGMSEITETQQMVFVFISGLNKECHRNV